MGHYSHWVSPFGYFRVNALIQLTETFRRLRVLHRLLMPRHPPVALTKLNYIIAFMQLVRIILKRHSNSLLFCFTFLSLIVITVNINIYLYS